MSMGLPAGDEDYILQNIRRNLGVVWNPSNLTREWTDFVKHFHLKKITVHDIRHSHATDLLSMGVPIQDVSRRLGHSDVSTTLKIYTHSNMEQDKLIARKLEERYGNKYVESKLNFNIIASIIIGENYADEKDIIQAINFITGQAVNYENRDTLLLSCRKYLLEKYSYLSNISLFLNKGIEDNTKKQFIELINNISNNLTNIRPMNTF